MMQNDALNGNPISMSIFGESCAETQGISMLSMDEKTHRVSQLPCAKSEMRHTSLEIQADNEKRSDFRVFQMSDNDTFSIQKGQKRQLKPKNIPEYRRINRYFKSTKQYWKERNRRKQALELSAKLKRKEIAKQLGVSEGTISRDLARRSRYDTGRFNTMISELQAERSRKIQEKLDGMTLGQRFDYLTKLIVERDKLLNFRRYVRHMLIIDIDMDDITDGCPTIRPQKLHNATCTMPINLVFKVRHDGKRETLGRLTLQHVHP